VLEIGVSPQKHQSSEAVAHHMPVTVVASAESLGSSQRTNHRYGTLWARRPDAVARERAS
jgi:hypothetical protein